MTREDAIVQSTTSIWPWCGTVSRWAQNSTQPLSRPASLAMTFPAPARPGPPASSSLTSNSIARNWSDHRIG